LDKRVTNENLQRARKSPIYYSDFSAATAASIDYYYAVFAHAVTTTNT